VFAGRASSDGGGGGGDAKPAADGYWPPLPGGDGQTSARPGHVQFRESTERPGAAERAPGVRGRGGGGGGRRATRAAAADYPDSPDTGTVRAANGLDATADTIFSGGGGGGGAASSPMQAKHIQKLSYAEKLQVMIMQVQDTITEEDDVQ
jgi:hypothetical protein